MSTAASGDWVEVGGWAVGPLPRHLDGAAARLFGDQFTDDPSWVAIVPRPRWLRRRVARWSFRVDLWLARRFDSGMVIANVLDDRILAVTLTWLQSPPRLPWWTMLLRALPIVPAGPLAGWRANEVFQTYVRVEPDEPHGNLYFSAADPAFKGAAHQVWLHSFRHMDDLGIPTYIEATWPRYEQLYGRYGYEVRDRIRLRTGAEVLGMWRDVGAGELKELPVRRRV